MENTHTHTHMCMSVCVCIGKFNENAMGGVMEGRKEGKYRADVGIVWIRRRGRRRKRRRKNTVLSTVAENKVINQFCYNKREQFKKIAMAKILYDIVWYTTLENVTHNKIIREKSVKMVTTRRWFISQPPPPASPSTFHIRHFNYNLIFHRK